MRAELAGTEEASTNEQLMAIDRRCHEIMWAAAGNRFLLDSLDTLYAQADRLWHLYLAEVADMRQAVGEHAVILDALAARAGDKVAELVEAHVRAFDADIRAAVTARLSTATAAEALKTSRRYTADEALAAGIVEHTAAETEVVDAVAKIAAAVAAEDRTVIAEHKRLLFADPARACGHDC